MNKAGNLKSTFWPPASGDRMAQKIFVDAKKI
jgi:hypothetical protein